MGDQRHLHWVRPYYWGAIYLSDAECQEDFDIDFRGDGPVYATASHVAIAVMHGGTIPDGTGDVTLDLRVEDNRVDGLPHELAFQLPSGRLHVGDADGDDEIALQPGSWLLQVASTTHGRPRMSRSRSHRCDALPFEPNGACGRRSP